MSYQQHRKQEHRPQDRSDEHPKLDFILTDDPDKLNESAEKWGKRWSDV